MIERYPFMDESKILLGNNEMAKLIGMKPSAFAKAVRTGRFSIAEYDLLNKPLYDPEVVVAQFEATKEIAQDQNRADIMPEGMRGGRPSGSGGGGRDVDKYYQIKLAKEGYKAKLIELEFKFRNGELIEKVEVEKQGAELGSIMIGEINSWASRLSPLLASMQGKDEHDFRLFLEQECNHLIVQIRERCGAD